MAFVVVVAGILALVQAQPLERRAEQVEIALPAEPIEAEVHAPDVGTPTDVRPSELADSRPTMPDPYRRKVGAVLLAAGAVSFATVVGLQVIPPLRWDDCVFIPPDERPRGSLTATATPQRDSVIVCPNTTFATWAHPIALVGTVAASALAGVGISRFGEADGARRARRGLPRRSGIVRLAIGGALAAAGIFGAFASVFLPEGVSRDCDTKDCMRRLSVVSSVGISMSATAAVVGSGLLGHALGERRASRRPGHIAYGVGLDGGGLRITAAARF